MASTRKIFLKVRVDVMMSDGTSELSEDVEEIVQDRVFDALLAINEDETHPLVNFLLDYAEVTDQSE